MSMHNKKTARLLQGVVLGLIIISATLFLGCENPVGGAEQNPIEELVGKVYKSEWDELFYISSADTIELGYQYEEGADNIIKVFNSKGKIIDRTTTEKGTVYLLKSIEHSNSTPSQYPEYEDKANIPHKDCYTLLYIQSITSKNVTWAQFASVTGKEPPSQTQYDAVTACFSNKADAEEYLDLNKWTSVLTSEATAQN